MHATIRYNSRNWSSQSKNINEIQNS